MFKPYFKNTSHLVQKIFIVLFLIGMPFIKVFSQCPPPAPIPYDNNSNGPSWMDLEGDDPVSSLEYRWYADEIGGNPLTNTNSDSYLFTTPLLTENDTFYVSQFDATCPVGQQESPKARSIAYIDPAPYPDDLNHEAFGDQVWYVYCYNDLFYQVYSGYYIDTDFNINSSLKWDQMKSPNYDSKIFGYNGGKIQKDNHGIIYKKQNFPAGIYRIDIDHHDDKCVLYVDGKLVFIHDSNSHSDLDVWTGPLGPNSTVEFRWIDFSEVSKGIVSLTQITPTNTLYAGRMDNNQTVCINTPAKKINSGGSKLNAYKDTYVNKTSPSQNFGSGDLIVNVSPLSYSYLAFDISKLTTEIQNGQLNISNQYVPVVPNMYVVLYAVSDTTWKENELNWDNQPAINQKIDSIRIIDAYATYFQLNIKDYLISELAAGRKKVAFALKLNNSYPFAIPLGSRESSIPPFISINQPKKSCYIDKYQWQIQPQCTGTFQDIASANGLSYNPGVITQNTCYRLQVVDACGNIANSDTTQISINNPVPPITSDTTICKNSIALLRATGNAIDYKWYDKATNGNLLFSGNNFSTQPLIKDTIFYVASIDNNNCIGNTRAAIHVTLSSGPVPPILSDTTVCKNSIAILKATGTADDYNWYDDATNGNLLFSGNNFNTQAINKDTTFYVASVDKGCIGDARAEVHVTLSRGPNPPILTDTAVCKNSIAILKATGSADDYNWYDDATSGNLLFSGKYFNTQALNKDTIFYVASVDKGCIGVNRSRVNVAQRPESIAGTISSTGSTLCGDISNKDTIRLSDYTGSQLDFLSSIDNFQTSQISIGNGTDEVFLKDLTITTYFKAIVKNGLCPADTTEPYQIKVNNTDPGNLSIEEVNTEKGILLLNGYTGNIIRWESSANEFVSFDSITNTSSEFTIHNNAPLYYRAVVQSESCPEEKSNFIRFGLIHRYSSFSPNNDGINDTWIIDNIENAKTNKVSIFNRWGNLVFETENYNNIDKVWNGTSNNGSSLGSTNLPDGTYFYSLILNDEKPVTGYVILKR